jgi:hypothetical protein
MYFFFALMVMPMHGFGVPAMVPMHEEVHHGTCKQEQVGENPEEMGLVLFPVQDDCDGQKADQHDPPRDAGAGALGVDFFQKASLRHLRGTQLPCR